jgi:hypothetical protein
LLDCEFERVPLPQARVRVSWNDDREFLGEATEPADEATEDRPVLRAAAEATAAALSQASEGLVHLDVLAVKAVEGFDTVIVVVSLQSEVAGVTERLVGSCLIRGEPERGAVLAVLSGTNRLFGKVVNV